MTDLRTEIDTAAAKRGKNRREVAGLAGVSESYFSDLMNRRRQFAPDVLKQLAVGLDLTETQARRWQKLGAIEAGWRLEASHD